MVEGACSAGRAMFPSSCFHPLAPLVVGDEGGDDEDDSDNAKEEHHGDSKEIATTAATVMMPQLGFPIHAMGQTCMDGGEGVWPAAYLPTTRMVKLPGTMAGRGRGFSGVGAGRGPNSAVVR